MAWRLRSQWLDVLAVEVLLALPVLHWVRLRLPRLLLRMLEQPQIGSLLRCCSAEY
jgi:hypothetical protein